MARIQLLRHRRPTEHYAEVDDDIADALSIIRWAVFKPIGSHTFYARAGIGGKTVYMHRMVMEAGDGDEIDHIDGNGLNNRRSNLRFVTHRENIRASFRMPGRYGAPTIEELDAELAEFESRQERLTNRV